MFHLVRQTMIWIKVGEVISRGLHLLSRGVIKDRASSLFRVIKSQEPSPWQPPLLWLFYHSPVSRLRLGLFLPLSLLRFHRVPPFHFLAEKSTKAEINIFFGADPLKHRRNKKPEETRRMLRNAAHTRRERPSGSTWYKLAHLNTSMCLRLVLNPQGIRL